MHWTKKVCFKRITYITRQKPNWKVEDEFLHGRNLIIFIKNELDLKLSSCERLDDSKQGILKKRQSLSQNDDFFSDGKINTIGYISMLIKCDDSWLLL